VNQRPLPLMTSNQLAARWTVPHDDKGCNRRRKQSSPGAKWSFASMDPRQSAILFLLLINTRDGATRVHLSETTLSDCESAID
jgi:hypothetical protein